MKKQTIREISSVLLNAKLFDLDLEIVSGEGESGTVEIYDGKKSLKAVLDRLRSECCNGDRWAFLQDSDGFRG